MRSPPDVGTVTVCEINRNLITTDALSDDRAKEAYGKLLGVVFTPVLFQPDGGARSSLDDCRDVGLDAEDGGVASQGSSLIDKVQGVVSDVVKRFFSPSFVHLLPEVDRHGISWHQHKNILAFICGPNEVSVRDYDDPEFKEPCTLTHESQKDVSVLEWRPNGGRILSVACKGGICIWAVSFPGNVASVRSRTPFIGSLPRGTGNRWTLVDFLRTNADEQITALSWSSSFTVWDVAQGVGTPIRRGLGGISFLKWSPTGDYFFSAKFDGTFYLWETNTWTSEPWSSSSGFVKGATWDTDGRMILIAFSSSKTLASVHFASRPPSLDALLLPIELPELSAIPGSEGIDKIAWNVSGERLAVSFGGGDDVYKGLIAVYDVKRTPVVKVSLIGFIRGSFAFCLLEQWVLLHLPSPVALHRASLIKGISSNRFVPPIDRVVIEST
ncbi:hypothetical protein MLD38_020107 [Melastoma candidum]|uniref:Uncharacterized protein n=1 Tax=Melastoma candidum TaxID=119954 RepID=A0ACB9QD55_9MYRT|nr:hypothetical protein MLD38_020107 [Melastoma candidum]